MSPEKIEDLMKRLDREEKILAGYGYGFPAIYDAIRALLKDRMPD